MCSLERKETKKNIFPYNKIEKYYNSNTQFDKNSNFAAIIFKYVY